MTHLDASENRVTNLQPIAELVAFKPLHASGNSLAELAPYAGLIDLRKLDMSNRRMGCAAGRPASALTAVRQQQFDRPLTLLSDLLSPCVLELQSNWIGGAEPLSSLTGLPYCGSATTTSATTLRWQRWWPENL